MKRSKFYVCKKCGNLVQSASKTQVFCCDEELNCLTAQQIDDCHKINVSIIEDDFYIEINHEMTKEHYISFVSYVAMDRVMTIRLYPEQNASVRFPKMFGGKLYFYCNNHGLFEYKC